jgi:hypothetical protein
VLPLALRKKPTSRRTCNLLRGVRVADLERQAAREVQHRHVSRPTTSITPVPADTKPSFTSYSARSKGRV